MGAGHSHALHVHGHSAVHRLAPEAKVAATLLFVVGSALTPMATWWAWALDAVALAVVARMAGVGAGFVLSRATVVAPFLLLALLTPFVAQGEEVQVLGVGLSREGLLAGGSLAARAVIGVCASILLAATTQMPDVLRGLERLRVPPVLTQIAMFMLRYLEVITGELTRMRTAMTARGYDPRWLWQAKPIAAGAGALFIRSYERGERVHAAMLARGYAGTMPSQHADRATAADWGRAGLLPAVSLTAALTAALLA